MNWTRWSRLISSTARSDRPCSRQRWRWDIQVERWTISFGWQFTNLGEKASLSDWSRTGRPRWSAITWRTWGIQDQWDDVVDLHRNCHKDWQQKPLHWQLSSWLRLKLKRFFWVLIRFLSFRPIFCLKVTVEVCGKTSKMKKRTYVRNVTMG